MARSPFRTIRVRLGIVAERQTHAPIFLHHRHALQYELTGNQGQVVAVGLLARVAGDDSILQTMHNADGVVARLHYNQVASDELKGTATYVMPDGSRREGPVVLRKDDPNTVTVTVTINDNQRQATIKRKTQDGD